ncbi:uncharacterized protein LOC124934421 [Impatiens glandulifera]|uniref:uncharacterized protein LOC124934421 n=1 Tax=Impatiens glandulifera TaxID=253017 RepID=UPI001FB0E067|nr:uncharacterized protein LOC124934421 [Impatiens glandulifera]
MDRVRITENGNSDFSYRHNPLDQRSMITDRYDMEDISSSFSSPSPSIPPLPPSCSSSGGTITVVSGGVRYIVHRVTKMDTLAGVAIKYGVEVADIKRINGLVTDIQMFAHKSLHIPLSGRHLPSPNLSNGSENNGLNNSEQTHVRRRNSDLFDSFQALKLNYSPNKTVSPAMNSLQGYYGLKPNNPSDGCEMSVYSKGSSSSSTTTTTHYNPPLSVHRKSKSLANGLNENGEITNAETKEGDSDKWCMKLFRRRQKSEADFTSWTPEKILKEDNSSGGGFSATAGKGLALRSKPVNRNGSGFDTEIGSSFVNITDSLSGVVGKSSSGSSLQDQDSNGSSSLSSIWSTSKWSLKTDLQAFSSAAISKPIFDGLPNPITGWKNKEALD